MSKRDGSQSIEDQQVDRKSLRLITGHAPDWDALARNCVCFANGAGGRLLIGIEDGQVAPPSGQTIPVGLIDQLRRRVGELTVNVQALPTLHTTPDGHQFIELEIARCAGVASTTDGRYFIRVADTCCPLVGDDVMRLANERPGYAWEAVPGAVPFSAADAGQIARFVGGLRAADRVKDSVKEKSDTELMSHYGFLAGLVLTRLGVLLIGTAADRRALGTAPLVQAIKYDEQGRKINKWVWDDGALSPTELVDAVWRTVPDFSETYEVAEGLYRRQVPAYDEKVVRELLVNALVHRPYSQQGDIFVNLHPDRLEMVNPGRLPLGVTPQNILHASRRRNDALARVFHGLGLMEREGSGYDLMYDRLLSQGRPVPATEEGPDWVRVTIQRRIVRLGVLRLIADAEARFQLNQRERITLGALAQSEGMMAQELAALLEVDGAATLVPWLGRLLDLRLVQRAGRTKGTRYYVDPALLRDAGLPLTTSLRHEPHRLRELVREDVRRYPKSRIGEICLRVGSEVPRAQVKRALAQLVGSGALSMSGKKATARYRLAAGPEAP